MSFKEYLLKDSTDLLEQAIAMKGDWHEGVGTLGQQGEMGMKKWNKLTDITLPKLSHKYEFYQLQNSLLFKIGYWENETIKTKIGDETRPIFTEIFEIGLTRYKSLESKLKYPKLIGVAGVAIISSLHNKGISTFVYKYLVNEMGYTILGDEKQYFGARKLWARLSKELDVKVDIIDAKSKTVIQNNIILHHGKYDEDLDKALWSYKDDKKNLRSVLTKII